LRIKAHTLPISDNILKKQFELIFREHFTGLVYFAQKYLTDLDSSKEVVHAVFVKIWENRHQFEFDKPAKAYLFASVYNRSLNVIRNNKKFYDTIDDNSPIESWDTGEYSDSMEVAELESKIKIAIQKLPEKCREVFELNRFEGKKYQEIADHLNISVKTVEAQMSKALKVLKEELKDYLYLWVLFL
jgi:RNA polymerase sigma-70 factor (ECF subfamily)